MKKDYDSGNGVGGRRGKGEGIDVEEDRDLGHETERGVREGFFFSSSPCIGKAAASLHFAGRRGGLGKGTTVIPWEMWGWRGARARRIG